MENKVTPTLFFLIYLPYLLARALILTNQYRVYFFLLFVGENLRKEISKYHDEKAKTVQEQRDLEVAMWHQLKINNQEDQERKKVQNFDGSGVNYNQDQSLPSYAPPDRSTKPKSTASAPVIPDRSSKPSSMSLYSGSGGLRQVTVPNMLMAKFLSIAQSNTSSNIETCGFLTGRLSQNQFKITHLLIPKQTGTSDSCVTSGEETMFDYQEKHDLITLGWVSYSSRILVCYIQI